MTLPVFLSFAALACSRDGQAIGEGLAWFYTRVAWTIIAVLGIAVASGVLVGYRRRAILRQVAWHLLWGVVLLVVGAAAGMVAVEIWDSSSRSRARRDMAAAEAWMAPLANPPAGELDRALAEVVDMDGASAAGRRLYLIVALPPVFERVAGPLNPQERAAVLAVAARLRQENTERALGSDPGNLDRLDAAASWLVEKPDLPAALQGCAGRSECKDRVLQFADMWCAQALEACRAAFDPAHLDAAEALIAADRYALAGRLGGIRRRVEAAPLPAAGR